MQRYLAVVMEIAVKVPLQKASVSQSVTRQNAVILTPILFAVHQHLCQTISVCLHFRMKQNKSPEKVEVIGTGWTSFSNLNCMGLFLPEIV